MWIEYRLKVSFLLKIPERKDWWLGETILVHTNVLDEMKLV